MPWRPTAVRLARVAHPLGKDVIELTDDANAEAGWDQALERLAEYLAKEAAP
jgi:hypothetical protein